MLLNTFRNIVENNGETTFLSIPLPIVAAIIGAFSALIVQGLIWLIKTRHEKKEKSRELLSEIYSISYLIGEYFKELVMHKVHKNYWLKAAKLSLDEYQKIYYNNHLESNKDSFSVQNKISEAFANYTKAVRKFLFLNGKDGIVDDELDNLQNFQPRKASTLDGIEYDKLRESATEEEIKLNKEYLNYRHYFKKINQLLANKL